MDDLIYVAIIGILIGVYLLIRRFKYPVKEGSFKFLINFQSLTIGIFCLVAGLIALVKYLILLFSCN
jgi:hypothetical protein